MLQIVSALETGLYRCGDNDGIVVESTVARTGIVMADVFTVSLIDHDEPVTSIGEMVVLDVNSLRGSHSNADRCFNRSKVAPR